MLYLVAYDLNKPEQDYPDLIKTLSGYPNKHIQKSVWLIVSTETADQIVNKLQQFFDRNDTLIVLAWNSNRQGLLLKEDWDWINSNV